MHSNLLGSLYVVSSPSGGGKSSLVNAILDEVVNVCLSVSYTTRPQRVNEVHGKDYFFVSDAEFNKLINEGEFLEYNTVFGYRYGTSKKIINSFQEQGYDVMLDVDWQGFLQIKDQVPNCIGVYILPPSKQVLLSRLLSRKRDDEQTILNRMAGVSEQTRFCSKFDYIVVNDDFSSALEHLGAIISVNRLRSSFQLTRYRNIVDELLADSE